MLRQQYGSGNSCTGGIIILENNLEYIGVTSPLVSLTGKIESEIEIKRGREREKREREREREEERDRNGTLQRTKSSHVSSASGFIWSLMLQSLLLLLPFSFSFWFIRLLCFFFRCMVQCCMYQISYYP